MTSRKLNFDEESKQFIALYTNMKGEEIEKYLLGNQLKKPLKKLSNSGKMLISCLYVRE